MNQTARFIVNVDARRMKFDDPKDMIAAVVSEVSVGDYKRISVTSLENKGRESIITKSDGCLCRIESVTQNQKTGEKMSSLTRVYEKYRIRPVVGGHFVA